MCPQDDAAVPPKLGRQFRSASLGPVCDRTKRPTLLFILSDLPDAIRPRKSFAMIYPVIDFNVYRLRRQFGTLRLRCASPPSSLPPSRSAQDRNAAISDDITGLVTALVLRITRRRGRSLSALPGVVRDALCDLVAQSDPTACLLFQWLDREQDTDAAVMEAARQPDKRRNRLQPSSKTERPIYRHHRFWKPQSSRLAELDRRRLLQLQSLLEEEIRHDR